MAIVRGPPVSFECDDVLILRRNRLLLAIAGAPLLAALMVAVEGDAAMARLLAAGGALLTVVLWWRNPRPRFEQIAVRADADGVALAGRFVARSTLRAALATPGVAPRVVLRRRVLPAFELQMESQPQARALLQALGLDASSAAVDFYGRSWVETHWAYYLGTLAAMPLVGYVLSKAGEVGRVLSYPAAAAVLGALFWRLRLRVGAEGVTVRWFWVHRVIAYDAIEDVARYEESTGLAAVTIGIHIRTRTGVMRLPMGSKRNIFGRYVGPGETTIALASERMREAALAFEQRRADKAPAPPHPDERRAIQPPPEQTADQTATDIAARPERSTIRRDDRQ